MNMTRCGNYERSRCSRRFTSRRFCKVSALVIILTSVAGCGIGEAILGSALLEAFRQAILQVGGGGGPAGNPTPEAPSVIDVSATTTEDTPLTVEVITGNSLVDAVLSTLAVTVTTAPTNGTAVINPATKAIQYTPNANFNGTDTFVIQVCTAGIPPLCASATVNITVTPVNDAPTAVADTNSITEDVIPNTVTGNLLTNDSDVEGGLIAVSRIAGNAANVGNPVAGTFGSLTAIADGSYTYALDNTNLAVQALSQGQIVTDVFAYTINDGTAATDSTLTVDVVGANDAPVAGSENGGLAEDIPAIIDVLFNDLDIDVPSVLTVTITNPPANGNAVVNPDNTITYTPNLDYVGADQLDYQVCDNGVPPLCATATVLLTVDAVNDPPVNTVPAAQSFDEDSTFVFSVANGNAISTSDVDVGANPLQVTLTVTNGILSLSGTGGLAFSVGNGIADQTMTFTGTLTDVNNALNGLSYFPFTDYSGAASLTISTDDQGATGSGGAQTDTDVVNITVNPINDQPNAIDDNATTNEDTPTNISVLANDIDVDGDPLTVAILTGPASGSVVLNPDNTFTYTPSANFNGTDSFMYVANDGTVNSINATVNITVNPINDPPVAVNDSYSTNEDTLLPIASPGNLVNDSDVDLDPLITILVTGPAHGTLTFNADGGFDYTPDADFNGNDSFTYKANDGIADSNVVTVTITINPINDPPVAVDDGPYTVTSGLSITISGPGVLANDTDVDTGALLTAILVTPPTNGTFTSSADGSFSYLHDGSSGTADSFTYQVQDEFGALSNIATVFINIQTGPAANDDAYTTSPDTPLTVSPADGVILGGSLGGVADTGNPTPAVTQYGDSGTMGITPGTNYVFPSGSTINMNADGSFTYTPFTGFVGNDQFDYEIGNGIGTDIGTVTLTVTCPTITVTNPANTNGTASAPFSETFTQTGATGTATFTTASTLPTGITLATNGVLSGTPTQTGTFPIVVTVTDSAACTGTGATYNLVIACQMITVTNPANTSGTVGSPFSETFTQTGAIGTATFTTASTLPSGVTLATNGVLSGTPGQPGSFPIVVTVTDSNGCTGTSATYNLVIACQTITVTNPANTNGTLNVAFSETFTQTSAIGTATFTTASTLPSGLSLATNGVLSGIPGQSGTFPIVVTVTDSNGCTGTSATYTLAINAPPVAANDPNGGLPSNSSPPGGANPHPYHTALNTPLTVADGANDLLANDDLGFPVAAITSFGDSLVTVTTFTTFGSAVSNATAQGGTLTVNLDGSFSYTPPSATFTGLDGFAYRLTNSVASADAEVTIAVGVRPAATNDAHAVTGNIQIDTSTGTPFSVVTNDIGDMIAVNSMSPTSAQNGQVAHLINGQFTYNPPAGFTGSDSFTYTVGNGFGDVQGTVNLTVSNMVWFVDNNLGVNGTGRRSDPFNVLSSADAASPSGVTFIFRNTATNYVGGYTFNASERLLGNGIAFNAANLGFTPAEHSINLPAGGGTKPILTGAVTLATSGHVRGLNIASTAAGLSGSSATGVTVDNIDSLSATGSPAVSLDACSGTVTLGALTSTNSATTGVSLTNISSALTFAVTGATTITNPTGIGISIATVSSAATSIRFGTDAAGTAANGLTTINSRHNQGININNADNTTGDIRFGNTTFGLAFAGGSGNAVNIVGGTAADVSFLDLDIAHSTSNLSGIIATDMTGTLGTTSGTINTGSATAINIDGPAGLTPLAITLTSVSCNGASTGISIVDTSGTFTVTGDGNTSVGGNSSGGTIQNTTSHGISLTRTASPSFTNMNIQGTAGSGITGTGVNNFTLQNSSINNSGTGGAPDESNIAFDDQAAGTENNISGVVTITNNTLTNSRYHGVRILNYNGTMSDLVITGNTITSSTSVASSLGSGVQIQAIGSTSTVSNITKGNISNNTITNFPSDAGIEVKGGNSTATGAGGTMGTPGSATNIINITGNSIRGQSAANRMGTMFVDIGISGGNSGSRSQANFNISNNGTLANPLQHSAGIGISIGNTGYATSTVTTSNNFIVANNTVASAGIGGGNGLVSNTAETPDLEWTINNNVISQTDGNGILAVARAINGNLKVTIQNNTVGAPLGGVRPGIRVDAGNGAVPTGAGTEDAAVCLNISGNTSAGSSGHPGLGLRKQGTTSTVNDFGIEGMAATSSPGIEAYVDGLNPAGGGTLLISAASGFSNCSSAP
jgi:VCBS repeat-containing protein